MHLFGIEWTTLSYDNCVRYYSIHHSTLSSQSTLGLICSSETFLLLPLSDIEKMGWTACWHLDTVITPLFNHHLHLCLFPIISQLWGHYNQASPPVMDPCLVKRADEGDSDCWQGQKELSKQLLLVMTANERIHITAQFKSREVFITNKPTGFWSLWHSSLHNLVWELGFLAFWQENIVNALKLFVKLFVYFNLILMYVPYPGEINILFLMKMNIIIILAKYNII